MTRWERTFFTLLYKLPPWMRWLLVVPAAILADLLTQSICRFLAFIVVPKTALPFVEYFTWQAFAPLMFVIVGVQIAPSRKFVTALVLGGLKIYVAFVNAHMAFTYILRGGSWLSRDDIVASPLWWSMSVYFVCIVLLLSFAVLMRKVGDKEPVIE